MNNLILVFFCLLPFGSFFFKSVDIWHGQGQLVQVGILILFAYSFFERPKYVQPLNRPIGAFMGWAGLVTSYWWITLFAKTQRYPLKLFMPFFNLLCLVWLYKIIVEYSTKNCIEKILKCLKYAITLILVYCVVQYLKVDEFHKGIAGLKINHLVGIMGNSGHLAGLLAITQPLFFDKTRENILSLILLWLIILVVGSASSLLVGLCVVLFWLFFKKRYVWFWSGVVTSVTLFTFIFIKFRDFFANNQRFEVWGKAFELLKGRIITGFGLGYFDALNIKLDGMNKYNHLHNDWYQVVFELGLVGLVLALWIVWDYFDKFRKNKTDLTIKLAGIFLGFCILCFFSFPAHLWVMSVLALFTYAGIYAINNGVKIEDTADNTAKSSN